MLDVKIGSASLMISNRPCSMIISIFTHGYEALWLNMKSIFVCLEIVLETCETKKTVLNCET